MNIVILTILNENRLRIIQESHQYQNSIPKVLHRYHLNVDVVIQLIRGAGAGHFGASNPPVQKAEFLHHDVANFLES